MRTGERYWQPKTKRARVTYLFKEGMAEVVKTYYSLNKSLDLSERAIQNRCYKFAGTSPHALRATAQNYMNFILNLSMGVVASLLGHQDVRTTMKHYQTLNHAQAESYLINHFNSPQ